MKIGGFQKFSLIDYPGKVAAIVFTQGCNFNCIYCHNRELIGPNGNEINPNDVFEFLKSRKGRLDALVITGGEPTLQPGLINFMKKVKKLGFLVKLDTNGSDPDVVKKAFETKVVDFVAMDIKAPFDKYSLVANCRVDCEKIKESINLIKNSGIKYEFRTTVPKTVLKSDDLEKIKELTPDGYIKFQKCNEEFLTPVL